MATQVLLQGPTEEMQNLFGFTLDIEMKNSRMISLKAAPLDRFDEGLDEWIELTPEELRQPGFVGNSLKLKSRKGKTQQTYFNEKGFFTLAEVVEKIVDFERIDRKDPKNEWFGGIDCHHIFFEGLHPIGDDAYYIYWGS